MVLFMIGKCMAINTHLIDTTFFLHDFNLTPNRKYLSNLESNKHGRKRKEGKKEGRKV